MTTRRQINNSFLKATRLISKLSACSRHEEDKMDTTLDKDSTMDSPNLEEFDMPLDPDVIMEEEQEISPKVSPTILRRDAVIRKYRWKEATRRTVVCPDCGNAFFATVDYHWHGIECGEAFFMEQAWAEHSVAQASSEVPDVSKDSIKPEVNKGPPRPLRRRRVQI